MPTKPQSHAQLQAARARAERGGDYDRRRGSAARRGYDGTWRAVRQQQLQRHPLCEHCLAQGRTTAAGEVDHIRAVRRGGAMLDADNLQSLCKPCHSRKTAIHDGGLGHRLTALAG